MTPSQSAHTSKAILLKHRVMSDVALLAIRGYYLDSMGKKGENDRGIYDDAIFLVTPELHMAFQANTDPSAYRDGIATLQPGTWMYKVGVHGLNKPKHKQYKALVQAAEVVVTRDGKGRDKGWFGINIHRGGSATTSSLGCQTIPPDQWKSFFQSVTEQMAKYNKSVIPYLLIENTPQTNQKQGVKP